MFFLLRGPNSKHCTVAVDVGYGVQVLWPEFQDAVAIFTPDLLSNYTRKSTVNCVRDICSSHSSVDADSSSGMLRRVDW